MNQRTQRIDQIAAWDMSRVESRLEAALHGVNPRPDFVSGLRNRLDHEPIPVRSNQQAFQYAVVTVAGVAGAVLLILAGIKAVVALLSVLGVLHQVSRVRNEPSQV
jgi:hypothetical protein